MRRIVVYYRVKGFEASSFTDRKRAAECARILRTQLLAYNRMGNLVREEQP